MIECRNLSVLRNGKIIIDRLSFSIGPGEVFCLLGTNGAGKSTAMSVLSTLRRPDSGELRMLGYDPFKHSSKVRGSIGVVFQEGSTDDRLTGRETLRIHAALHLMAPKEVRARVDEALEWAGLLEVQHDLVRTFSGGMRRRLELARALMNGPKILLMDEPTAGLDPQSRRDLWDRIKSCKKDGASVFVTTQYLHEAETCDFVGVIDCGRLVEVGAPDDLKKRVLGRSDCSLEEVFIAITGKDVRDGRAGSRDQMASFARRGGELTR